MPQYTTIKSGMSDSAPQEVGSRHPRRRGLRRQLFAAVGLLVVLVVFTVPANASNNDGAATEPTAASTNSLFNPYDTVIVPGPFGSSCHVGVEQNRLNYFIGAPIRYTIATPVHCAQAGPVVDPNADTRFYLKHAGMLSKSGQPNWLTFPVVAWIADGSSHIDIGNDHVVYSPNGGFSTVLAVCDSQPHPDACGYPGVYVPN